MTVEHGYDHEKTKDFESDLKSRYSAKLDVLLALEPDSDPFDRNRIYFSEPWQNANGAFVWVDDEDNVIMKLIDYNDAFDDAVLTEDRDIARMSALLIAYSELRRKIAETCLNIDIEPFEDRLKARENEILDKVELSYPTVEINEEN